MKHLQNDHDKSDGKMVLLPLMPCTAGGATVNPTLKYFRFYTFNYIIIRFSRDSVLYCIPKPHFSLEGGQIIDPISLQLNVKALGPAKTFPPLMELITLVAFRGR